MSLPTWAQNVLRKRLDIVERDDSEPDWSEAYTNMETLVDYENGPVKTSKESKAEKNGD